MKKTILLSSLFAVGAALATTVESGNAVGALDVSLANNKSTLIAVPFVGYGDEGAVAVQDMVKTSDLAEDSKLYVPDGQGNYNVWRLNDKGVWVSVDNVLIDNKGDSSQKKTEHAGSVTVNRGDSFWLEPKFTTGTTGTVFLLGQGDTTQGSSAITNGVWNLIGNTATSAKDVPAGAEGEKVCVPNADGGLDTYTFRKSAWCLEGSRDSATVTIQPGRGFWFLSKGTTSIAW